MALSTDTVSSSALFTCLMLATRVVHTCTQGHPHMKTTGVISSDLAGQQMSFLLVWEVLIITCTNVEAPVWLCTALLLEQGRLQLHWLWVDRVFYHIGLVDITIAFALKEGCVIWSCSSQNYTLPLELWVMYSILVKGCCDPQMCTSSLPSLECGMPLYVPYKFIASIHFHIPGYCYPVVWHNCMHHL
jgi:hypothetical protein